MTLFHGHTAATVTDKFHRGQFVFAHVSGVNILGTADDLVFELVRKNVFVFTINIAGLILEQGTTTTMLWQLHEKLAREVARDIIVLQEFATGQSFSRDRLIKGLVEGIEGDPDHQCKGRSAPGRLARALEIAEQGG